MTIGGERTPVTVYLPKRMYGALQSLARRHHVDIRDLIIEALRRVLHAETRPNQPTPNTTTRARRPWTPEDDARMRQLNREGHSDSRIAKTLGRSQALVSSWRRRAGLPAAAKFGGNRRLEVGE